MIEKPKYYLLQSFIDGKYYIGESTSESCRVGTWHPRYGVAFAASIYLNDNTVETMFIVQGCDILYKSKQLQRVLKRFKLTLI